MGDSYFPLPKHIAPIINVEKVHPDAIIPTKAHPTDAGWDLYTPIDIVLPSSGKIVIDSGIRMNIPEGYYGQLQLRSSMGTRGLVMPNSPGIIDAGYVGTIKFILSNITLKCITVFKFERVCQLIIQPVIPFVLIEGPVDMDTHRGEGGLGSTGR